MRDTLEVQKDIDALTDKLALLRSEKMAAPTAKKFAEFQRSGNGDWYGPYWRDSFSRPREFSRLVAEYSWTTVMVYDAEQGVVRQVTADLKIPIQSTEELREVCVDLIANPRTQ